MPPPNGHEANDGRKQGDYGTNIAEEMAEPMKNPVYTACLLEKIAEEKDGGEGAQEKQCLPFKGSMENIFGDLEGRQTEQKTEEHSGAEEANPQACPPEREKKDHQKDNPNLDEFDHNRVS